MEATGNKIFKEPMPL